MQLLADLRAARWAIADQNLYRDGGVEKQFWMLTHRDGRMIRGEGRFDEAGARAAFAAAAPGLHAEKCPTFWLARGVECACGGGEKPESDKG